MAARSRSVVLILALLVPGCAEEWGPERMRTTRVSGSVAVDGRPVTSGWIEFIPVEGTVGNLRVAPIEADGRYEADRVPVGRVAVALTAVPGPPILTPRGALPRSVFRFHTTPIRRTIPEGPAHRLDLDLGEEARSGLAPAGSTSSPPPRRRPGSRHA